MTHSPPRLATKVAVVTGASQGLGQYLAMGLAAEGAHVVLVARNQERLAAVCADIEQRGGSAVAIPADLTQHTECERVIELTVEHFGGIDILVLNAGMATYGTLDELTTFAPIEQAMQVNFFGAAYPTYLALDQVMARKGLIAYVTSGAGHLPMAGYLGYTTSKHAMNGFFEALRLELIPHGVDVLTINPGDMYSDDGAGRTVFGPDGSQHKVDLSIRRPNDIRRTPVSQIAAKCVDAIVARRRSVDFSAPHPENRQDRTLAPAAVDRRIYHTAVRMRSAFTGLVDEQIRRRDDPSYPPCPPGTTTAYPLTIGQEM